MDLHRPVPAAVAVGRTPSLKEPRLAAGRLFWLEQRPQERGRTTLCVRDGRDGPVRELTPAPRDLRSRVHDYGGGVYTVDSGTVVFVDGTDGCLWRLELEGDGGVEGPAPEPVRLTPPADPERPRGFADGWIDRRRRRWLGVMEQDGRDHLVSVPLAGGEPEVLRAADDFCGYAVASADGDSLAWVEWQQPFMPWERSRLWLARIEPAGSLANPVALAGSGPGDPRGISVFQPLWAGDDLVVANDRSGWWNLECLRGASRWLEPGRVRPAEPGPGTPEDPDWEPLLPMEAEFAMPQWVYGMRTTVWDGQQLQAIACRDGCWSLGRIAAGGWEPLTLPFDDLAALDCDGERLVAIAAAPFTLAGVLELELTSGDWRHTPAAPCPLAAERISRPESLWFEGHGGLPTHAWFHPPEGGAHAGSPLLVKGHSGPTAMARTGLNPGVTFWTSRGWGVVDVNYGGSTGFGRAYRERLDGQWGVVDVEDCAAAARALVQSGRADPQRIAIEGGSASGFTVLAALCFTEVFRAGACRYAVTDLADLARHSDHRFEARYLDTLVGPWPAAAATYAERSPLQHQQRIQAPLILFHGLEDRVVPPEQTERMALALSDRGVPVELHLFPGEGHGFRSQAVQVQVLEATEAFFRRHFTL
jgi:dipeptidyl aminopeptidase/acylaminoacyl peptidase